uniref:Uncharacterized protein n=1 Tax=Peronospora matthiolae TaxID=2874970 RepID=A0AAV1T4A1_9STRA
MLLDMDAAAFLVEVLFAFTIWLPWVGEVLLLETRIVLSISHNRPDKGHASNSLLTARYESKKIFDRINVNQFSSPWKLTDVVEQDFFRVSTTVIACIES